MKASTQLTSADTRTTSEPLVRADGAARTFGTGRSAVVAVHDHRLHDQCR